MKKYRYFKRYVAIGNNEDVFKMNYKDGEGFSRYLATEEAIVREGFKEISKEEYDMYQLKK